METVFWESRQNKYKTRQYTEFARRKQENQYEKY